jgi:hypothetical protein
LLARQSSWLLSSTNCLQDKGCQSRTPVKAKHDLTERSLFGGSSNNVFWPHHLCEHGDIWAILLLDNCSAHTELDASLLPKKLRIIFFPLNLTSWHQSADMGMIASLKVGDKFYLLSTLLAIFNEVGGYDQVEAACKRC